MTAEEREGALVPVTRPERTGDAKAEELEDSVDDLVAGGNGNPVVTGN
jgi:hypothetical protein